jgi:hypothetical protein
MHELETAPAPDLRFAGASRYRDVSHLHGIEAL